MGMVSEMVLLSITTVVVRVFAVLVPVRVLGSLVRGWMVRAAWVQVAWVQVACVQVSWVLVL